MYNAAIPMPLDQSEDQVNFALETLLNREDGWRMLVRELVARFPEAAPLELVLAITTACAAIERTFANGTHAREAAANGYRMASLFAVDVHALNLLALPSARAADLHAYWAQDAFFLTL